MRNSDSKIIADLAWIGVSAIIALILFFALNFNLSIPYSRGVVFVSDYWLFIYFFLALFCYVLVFVFYIRAQQSGFKRVFPFITVLIAGIILLVLLYPFSDMISMFLQATIYPPLSALASDNENNNISESVFLQTRLVMHSFQFFVFLILLYFSYRVGQAKAVDN